MHLEKVPLKFVNAANKKRTEEHLRYHSSKLELLVIVWSIKRFRQFLLEIKVVIVTDCQALLQLNSQKIPNAQIIRRALAL